MRAFQRAVSRDKVVEVIEAKSARSSWRSNLVGAPAHAVHHAGVRQRLISKAVHDDYDHFKYTFHGFLTSTIVAQVICDYTKDMLVGPFHLKTAVIMSEDAAWTTRRHTLSRMPAEGWP